MSLFDTPHDSWVAHSCNIEGIWGSGVAAQLKQISPHAFINYKGTCNRENRESLLGQVSYSHFDDLFNIANLYVSSLDSKNPDNAEDILFNTYCSLITFFRRIQSEGLNKTVYIPKINSGAFNVPWEKTEKIVKKLSDRYNINVIVCDPTLEE